jgi:acetyl esterase
MSMFRAVMAAAVALLAGFAGAGWAQAHEVDESYSIARRFEQYRGQYQGLKWPAMAPQAGQTILLDRVYKSIGQRDLLIDIFRPAKARSKGVGIVLVHGGAWRSGARSHFHPLANLLAQRGLTVFIPQYRLSPEAPYPAGAQDIHDAMVWAKAHSAQYGLKPDRIALGGASSGGQLASLVAYGDGLFGAEGHAYALVDMDGVLDFTTPEALQYENAAGASSSAAKWLGGSFEQVPDRWREASAASHVGPQSPPTLIISSGNPRFTQGKDKVLGELARHHIPARYYAFAKAPHDIWFYDPFLSTTANQIALFLQSLPQR